MLSQVTDGVLVHRSEFMQSNCVVVQGESGVLLIDPGITGAELDGVADDLAELGQPVLAGFSTHPHWDHLLWHPRFGTPPRYATEQCAATVRERLPDAAAKARVTAMMPPDLVDRVPLELLGELTGLPSGTTELDWSGPRVRIIEHRGHASGHAALLIEEHRVLVAGDLLSDILIPILDLGRPDPVRDYLAALDRLEQLAGDIEAVIPGHGGIGAVDEFSARIQQDRAYLQALRDGAESRDPRFDPPAYACEWLFGLHERQRDQLALRAGASEV